MNLESSFSSPATKAELKAVKKYFAPFPGWVWAAWVVALFLFLAAGGSESSDDAGGAALAAVFLLAVGLVGVVSWSRRPSGADMDRWLNRDLGLLKDRAIEKCGLTGVELTSETVLLAGPRFGVTQAEFAFRPHRRDVTRFTPVGVTVLNFTEHQIFAYQGALDRFTGNVVNETTDEYFYRDVVSVSTRTETLVVDKSELTRAARKALRRQIKGGKLQIPSAEVFRLTTSGGTSIEVTIEVLLDKLDRLVMGPGGAVEVNVAERALAGMRKMLRERKTPQPKDDAADELP